MGLQNKTTIGLAVAAVLLWAWIVGVEELDVVGNNDRDQITVFGNLKSVDVDGLVLETEYGRVELRRDRGDDEDDPDDDIWRIVDPVEDLADSGEVTRVLGGILNMPEGFAVEETDRAEFGLDDPKTTVRILTDGGDRERIVRFGNRAVLGNSVYFMAEGAKAADPEKIYTVRDTFLRQIERPVLAFRDRALIRMPYHHVRRLELRVTGEGGEAVDVVLTKSDKSEPWEMESPYTERPDQQAVEGYVQQLARLRASEFVDQDVEVGEPFLVATMADEEGDTAGPVKMGMMKKKTEDGTEVEALYGTVEGRKTVFALGPEARRLVLDPAELRERRVFPMVDGHDPVDHFTGFRFGSMKGDHWTVSQNPESGKWSVGVHTVAGDERSFDIWPTAFRDLLDVLRSMRVVEFVADHATDEQMAEWGIEPKPALTVRFYESGGDGHDIWLGRTEGEGAARRVYARIDGRGRAVFLLGSQAAGLIDRVSPEDFRDRVVWRMPEGGEIVSMTVDGQDPVVRDAGGEWPSRPVLRRAMSLGSIVTRSQAAGWKSLAGQVDEPGATLRWTWNDAEGAAHEQVLRVAVLPERPAVGEFRTDVPEAVEASLEGVEGVFWLDPGMVWTIFGVEPRQPPEEGGGGGEDEHDGD